jgi:hypothetical protein
MIAARPTMGFAVAPAIATRFAPIACVVPKF